MDETSNTTIYVTIGICARASSFGEESRFLVKEKIEVGEWPDTIMDSVLNVRAEVAERIGIREHGRLRVRPDFLFYEVYHTNDPSEMPFLFSNNSPAKIFQLEALEKISRSKRTLAMRILRSLKWLRPK